MISPTLKKVGFVSLWIGFLTLPFMGILKAILLVVLLLCGGIFFSVWMRWAQSERFRKWKAMLQVQSILFGGFWGGEGVQRGFVLLLLAVLLMIPWGLNDYYLDVLTLAVLYVVLALGLNIVVGLAGLLDLGYVAFYAVGAYTYAILSTQWGVSFWASLPIGAAMAALFGIFLGMITLRLRGDYLAIVTLGFLMIVHLVLNNWDEVTQGPNGILGIPNPSLGSWSFSTPAQFFYLILSLAVMVTFVVHRLNHSRIGRAWIAIREDEIAAASMGIPVTRMKILAFALGAGLAGMAGVFFAGRYAFVSPESFTFFETVFILSMVVLGGMGSIPGVILGALLLVILPELFRGLQDYRMLAFGGAMVLMMVLRPQGLLGNTRRQLDFGDKKA